MASTVTRRPLPALIALLALLLLTALVWWRVANRDDGSSAKAVKKTCAAPSTSAAPAAPRTLPPQKSVDVLVLNATSRSGLAARTRTTLLADGFRSTRRAGDDPLKGKVTGPGQIRYSAADRSAALLLQYYFPGAQLVQQTTASTQVTVSLGPTYRSVQPQKTVAARLAAARITLVTPTATPAASPARSC